MSIEYLTIKQAARMLKVHRTTVKRLIEDGELYSKRKRGKRYVRRDDVVRLERERHEQKLDGVRDELGLNS